MVRQAKIEVVICDQAQRVRNLIARGNETSSLMHIIMIKDMSEELKNFGKEKRVKIHSFSDIEGDSAPTKADSVISYLPLAHIFGQIIQFLMVGGSIGFFSGDISKLVNDMEILQPTFFPAVPRLLTKLYDKAQTLVRNKLKIELDADISAKETELRSVCKPFIESLGGRIRLIYSGAAPIYKNFLEFYTKIVGCKVIECYGQTECSGPCTTVLMDSNYAGNVGAPIPCCILKLEDVPEMGYFSKHSKGEVCIKGPGVFKGYLNDPKKTAEALDSDGWLHTGDIGIWLPEHLMRCDSWNDICKDPSVKKLILEDLKRIGKEAGLLSFEQVKNIHLYPTLLKYEGGFFTPTLKIKRDIWKKYFSKEIGTLTNSIQDHA